MPRSYVVRSRREDRDDAPRTRALRDQASLILRYARRVRDEDLARFAANLSARAGRSISAEELQAWEDGGSFPAWVLVAALELANLPSNAKRVADLVRSMRRRRPRRPRPPVTWARRITVGPSRSILVALAAALAIVLATLFAGEAAMRWGQGSPRGSPAAPPAFAVPGGAGPGSAPLLGVPFLSAAAPGLKPDPAASPPRRPDPSPSASPRAACASAGARSLDRPRPRSKAGSTPASCGGASAPGPRHPPDRRRAGKALAAEIMTGADQAMPGRTR